jgi:general secretion pathway protein D
MARPAPLDPAVEAAAMMQQAANAAQQKGQAEAGPDMPSVAPLPTTGAQPNTPAAGAQPNTPADQPNPNAGQPGAPPVQPPPAPRPPAGPAARNQPARPNQPTARPATDAAQQIQFDNNGLVTMHTNELDVRQLLELLSRRSGMNILVSPKVAGTITANFEGVTVQKVLESIIKLADLVDKQEGSIHYIYTKGERQETEEFTKKERILTKVYRLSYLRADEVLGVIRPFLSREVGQRRMSVTPSYRFGISESATFVSGGGQAMSIGGAGGGGGGMGGPGGSPTTGSGPTIGGFQPPTGGNSLADFDYLIIQDYESNLKIIDQIIQRLDIRPIQVLIEAVIISVDYEHDRELGVNLGLVDNLGQALGTIGSGTALNGNVGFTPTKLLTTSGTIAQGPVTDAQGFTSATNGVKFGFVSNNVTGFIRALETIGNTKILASPRILVLNKQRAEIQLGTRLGFQTLSQNFTSTIQQVQFLNTGTLLRLRPFVSDDGMVRMEIHPERSSGTVTNNIPNQNTAELTTNVMVPDGATLVIGGLIEDEDDYNYQGLPILSRFPALGFLTGINQKIEGRRELVVLLTPHIWSAEQVMAHAPTPHPIPGAPGTAGPVMNSSTTFDLETGKPIENAAAGGPTTSAPPGANPAAAAAGSIPAAPVPLMNAPADAQPNPNGPIASSNTANPPGTSPAAAAGNRDPNDPSQSRRRRWPSLRDWMAKKFHAKEADPARSTVASPTPALQTPAAIGASAQSAGLDPAIAAAAPPPADKGSTIASEAAIPPQTGEASTPAMGAAIAPPGVEAAAPAAEPAAAPQPGEGSAPATEPAAPPPGVGAAAPASEPGSPPAAPPVQPTYPNGGRPYLEVKPSPAPAVGAAMSQAYPRRDPMVAQAAWTSNSANGVKAQSQPANQGWTTPAVTRQRTQPQPADQGWTTPARVTRSPGIRPGAVVAGPRRHTIVQGETLSSIARLYYGSDHYAESLRKYNRGRIARDGLRPGDLLVIPPREELGGGGWVVQPR